VIAVSKFLSTLMPQVIGCPRPTASRAVVDSAIDFCSRSLVLTYALQPLPTRVGDNTYWLELPEQTALVQVLRAWYDDTVLRPVTLDSVYVSEAPAGTPHSYYGEHLDIDEEYSLRLYPTPDAVGSLLVRAALKPIRNATLLNNQLYNDWYEAIVDGALARLCSLPGENFTNPEVAMSARIRARTAANDARRDALHAKVQSPVSVTMRAF